MVFQNTVDEAVLVFGGMPFVVADINPYSQVPVTVYLRLWDHVLEVSDHPKQLPAKNVRKDLSKRHQLPVKCPY